MLKVGRLSETRREQNVVMVVMAGALLALAGVGGYEIGITAHRAPVAQGPAVTAHTCGASQDAPPATGLQP